MSKLQIISDRNSKILRFKNLVSIEVKKFEKQFKNIAIIIGGDGFMLQVLKKYR